MEKELYITNPFLDEFNQPNGKEKTKFYIATQHHHNKHQIINKKMIQEFPNEDYYENKKVKPGINLYKIILETEEKRKQNQYNGPYLNLSIPDTLLYYENVYYLLKWNLSKIQVQQDINYMYGQQIFKSKANDVIPYALSLQGNGIMLDKTIIMNDQAPMRIFPKSDNQVVTRYIMPYRLYPNLIRLFFYSKESRNVRKSYAYKIVNKQQMNQQIFTRKHKLQHQFLVNLHRDDSWTIILMKGLAIQNIQNMTQSLTTYLEKSKGVKIFQMVLDFIIDQNKIPWFYQIKSIKSTNLTSKWNIGTPSQICEIAKQNNNQIICPLCNLTYCKQQMQKIITNKLIYQLIIHLQLRGKQLNNIKFSKYKKPDGFTIVCNLCYQVISAQHTLINIQQQFSKLLNININDLQRVPYQYQKDFRNKKLNNQLSKNIKNLYQWRLIIYIHKIKNVEDRGCYRNGINVQMMFKGKKDKFSKKIHEYSLKNSLSSGRVFNKQLFCDKLLSQQSFNKDKKFFNRENGYPTNHTSQTMQYSVDDEDKLIIPIQRAKVHIFFSKESCISQFLEDAKIIFNVQYNNQVFAGQSSTLQNFKDRQTCQRHSSQVYLFNKNLKYCNLEMTVGLIGDGITTNNYYQMEQINGFYFPKKGLSNCNPLPNQWIQIFTDGKIPYSADQLQDITNKNILKDCEKDCKKSIMEIIL